MTSPLRPLTPSTPQLLRLRPTPIDVSSPPPAYSAPSTPGPSPTPSVDASTPVPRKCDAPPLSKEDVAALLQHTDHTEAATLILSVLPTAEKGDDGYQVPCPNVARRHASDLLVGRLQGDEDCLTHRCTHPSCEKYEPVIVAIYDEFCNAVYQAQDNAVYGEEPPPPAASVQLAQRLRAHNEGLLDKAPFVRQQIVRRAGGEQAPSSWGQYTDRHVVEAIIGRQYARVG